MKQLTKVLITGIGILGLVGCGAEGNAEENAGALPDHNVATYPVGSGTYNEIAAVSDALTSAYGTSIRLTPADTGTGRVTMLVEQQAELGRIGEEYWYAFEADHDFASESWGPTDINMVWPIEAPLGIAVAENSNIDSAADLAGKKIPYIQANASANNKMDAALALGGLTRDDIEEVPLGGYGEGPDALRSGQVDAIPFNSVGSAMEELSAQFDFKWIELNETDPEDLKTMEEIAPTVTVTEVEAAVGTGDGESGDALSYAVPLVALAEQDEEFVYEYLVAMADQYDSYAESVVGMESHLPENVSHEPSVVPFHPGLIKFLDEQGLWTEEAAEKNDELLARGELLQEEWAKYTEQADDDISHESWSEWKSAHIDG